MKTNENLNAVFCTDLKHLLVVSYIVLANNAVSNRFIEKRFNMPVQAWSSLFAIETFPGIKAKEIRKLFPRPQNTISRAIALLDSYNYIRQNASVADGREKKLFITRSGSKILKDIRAVSLDRQEELFSVLSESERKVFFKLACKIAYGEGLTDSNVMMDE